MPTIINPTNKTAFNQRIAAEGRFEQYAAVREELKRNSVSDRLAWRIASQLFPPLNGSPHEVSLTPEEQAACDAALAELKVEKLDGTTGVVAPPPPPKMEKSGFTHYAKSAKAAAEGSAEWHKHWTELAKKVDATKQANAHESILWVLANCLIPPDELTPEQIPDRGTLTMMKWVQSNPANLSEFMRTLFAKTIPDKKQLEFESRRRDDGRMLFERIDLVIESVDEKQNETEPDNEEVVA